MPAITVEGDDWVDREIGRGEIGRGGDGTQRMTKL